MGRESRKKRWAPFAPTWDMSENIVLEMTIEPPPKTSLNSTTTMGGGAAMEIGDLKTAMADLSNGFQNGSIGGALGMNVTTMAMQEPIYVPTPEDLPPQCLWQDEDPLADCYLDSSQNGQDGIPWSGASIANATAKLEESLAVKELMVPKKLMVMEEPGNAFEMLPFGVQPVIYAVDQDGKYVNEVGGEADPWLVTASVSNGTGLLINNITCAFKAGLCQFEDVAIDTMGHDYELTFSLTYGSDSVEDATSAGFDVGGRPLSVKFTDLDTLNPEGAPFSAVVAVWDDALNMKAALSGVTEVAVLDGEANFAELEVTGEVTGSQLMVSCSDADDFNHVGASGDFNVHRYPRTGNLKETSQKFSFKGDGQKLKNVMAAMGDFLQSSVAGVRK